MFGFVALPSHPIDDARLAVEALLDALMANISGRACGRLSLIRSRRAIGFILSGCA